MRIGNDGVLVPPEVLDRLGLEIAGRRIWAFSPARDGRPVDGGRFVPWPPLLRPHLDGRAHVRLRSLDTQTILFDEHVTFGSGVGEVDVVDALGRPLAIDKRDHLTPMFSDSSDEDRGALVDAVVQVLELMQSLGHDAFLAYGNLLGAVRDGRLIGHDNDADVAFLAKSSHPFDFILESFRLERELQNAGWETSRLSAGTFKLWKSLPTGLRVAIDVFTAFYMDGLLHMMPSVAGPLPREALLPTSTVVLEGRDVPAPARPEELLELTYGAGWRVPDPTFEFAEPRWVRRRLGGLLRGERHGIRHWDLFYETGADRLSPEPTAFARWVLSQEPAPRSILDVGCGTGRDSVWFADQGVDVIGCDYALPALHLASELASRRASPAAFKRLNLYDLRQMLAVGARMAHERDADAVYARWLVHMLEDRGRHALWRFSRSVLGRTRGRIYLEFPNDAVEDEFGDHGRWVVEPGQVRAELASYGFDIVYSDDSHGGRPVSRVVATLKGRP